MSAHVRYLRLTALRSRAPLVPLVASLFSLIGVFFYERNEVGPTWALTALLSCALAAWLVGAVLAGEPEAQADMATAALGGRRSRTAMDLVLVGVVSSGLTVAFVSYPVLLIALGKPEFEPPPHAGDVAAAILSQLVCAALGGTIGMLFSPPRVIRRATSTAAVLATFLVLVALSDRLGAAGGPAAVAQTLSDARPGTLDGSELVAWLSCIALIVVSVVVAAGWTRRRG